MDRARMDELLEEFIAYLTICKRAYKELEYAEPMPFEALKLGTYLDKLDKVLAGLIEIFEEDE